MFSRSISVTDAAPTPTATARFPDQRGKPLALRGAEGLGVADAGDPVAARIHDHGRRDDRAARGRDADLIDTGDTGQALVPQAALVAEGRDDDGHRSSG